MGANVGGREPGIAHLLGGGLARRDKDERRYFSINSHTLLHFFVASECRDDGETVRAERSSDVDGGAGT